MKIEYDKPKEITKTIIESLAYGHATIALDNTGVKEKDLYNKMHSVIREAFIRGYAYGSGELEVKVAKIKGS